MKFGSFVFRRPLFYLDIPLLLISVLLASALVEGEQALHVTTSAARYFGIILTLDLAVFTLGRIYEISSRFYSLRDGAYLTITIFASSVLEHVTIGWLEIGQVWTWGTTRFLVVHFFLKIILMNASRGGSRYYAERSQYGKGTKNGRRTLIFGTGPDAIYLGDRANTDPSLNINVIGYISEQSTPRTQRLHGKPLLGCKTDISHLVRTYKIEQVLLAVPEISQEDLRSIVAILHENRIRPRVISTLKFDDAAPVTLTRDLSLIDLLSRPRKQLDLSSISSFLTGKRILVTGGGGSIGAELVKQILQHHPEHVFVVDSSEANLFWLDHDLAGRTEEARHSCHLIDIKNRTLVRNFFKEHRPEHVFHAAAYKHAHFVEESPSQAILNNVQGTLNVIEEAESAKVESFTLVSTDKAVNPVGVMGATKRVCELLVTAAAIRTKKRYQCVRFGNVLGSSGSLVPLLKRQIRAGGPITITDARMTRYFMLIPEAVALILKASSLSNPGDINILKMGEPISILEIAKSLILLLGRRPEDIPVVFTGLRPGERLHEELYILGDEIQTEHPDILALPHGAVPNQTLPSLTKTLLSKVGELIRLAEAGDPNCRKVLMEFVVSYDRGQRSPEIRRAA